MNICSLVPGATEIVAALGLADHLVAVSHECDYPDSIRGVPVAVEPMVRAAETSSAEIDSQVRTLVETGRPLYRLNRDLLNQCRPDLVLAQDLCHVCAVTPDDLQQTIAGMPTRPRLLTLNPVMLDDVLADVERIGEATDHVVEAGHVARSLRARLDAVRARVEGNARKPRVACLEWLSPLYAAGHWVPEMVTFAGGRDVLAEPGRPSRRITWDEVAAASPDVIVWMPCGFSIDRTMQELTTLSAGPQWEMPAALRATPAYVVEAVSYFSRPGPRLVDGVEILAAFLHPDPAYPLNPRDARPVH